MLVLRGREDLPVDDLRMQLEVNVIGQVAVTQAFLPFLRLARGRIINMGSINGRLAVPFVGAYCASKFALEAVTDALRQELRPWNILVSIVEPGSVDTPVWWKGLLAAQQLEERTPRSILNLYEPAVIRLRQTAEKFAQGAIPPKKVARTVAHALRSKRPRTSYVVGWDARLHGDLALFVPDRIRDLLVASELGISSSSVGWGR